MDEYDIGEVENDPWEGCITADDILRMKSHIRPMPFPDYMTPCGGAPLENIDDETLLTAPPHVIAHIQRTAAQGGLQVISPRQVPFSYLMRRSRGGDHQLGDHVVGSIAQESSEWPTIDGESVDHWLPDEPLPEVGAERSHRAKTRTVSLTSSSYELTDPVLSCLVKGRAVIDILRRDDVQGGADVYTELLAKAWGIDRKDIDDLESFTLGVEGPLLRHAIKTDEVYSVMYAPIHVRRSISVGVSEVTRSYLPEDSAMDWRRMRVFCEAVFSMAVSIEGHNITLMGAMPPPGDPGARTDRPNVLCFQPSPAIAWTYESSSFSMFPMPPEPGMRSSAIPRDVLLSLSKYVEVVRPVSHMLAQGYKVGAKRSVAEKIEMPVGESITSSYRLMVQSMSVGAVRGRQAASTMRNAIYSALEQAPLPVRMRIVRYVKIAREECLAHLGLSQVPDSMIVSLANRFLSIGALIRNKVVAEASRRGASAAVWWSHILAQAPKRYEEFAEGTRGWAIIGMWMLFHAPTDRWEKLEVALNFSALRDAEVMAVGGLSLPPEQGSPERLLAAARSVVKKISSAYASYYTGVSDVGMALSDVALEMKRKKSSLVLKEAAYLWMLRARALRGTNVDLISKDNETESHNHLRVQGPNVDLIIAPTPYRAFKAYQVHVSRSEILGRPYKKHIAKDWGPPLSLIFCGWGQPIYPVPKTTLTRYLAKPSDLGDAMEKAWRELRVDVTRVMAVYGEKRRSPPSSPPPTKVQRIQQVDILPVPQPATEGGMGFWDCVGRLEEDQNEWIEMVLEKLGPMYEEAFYEKRFESPNQLLGELLVLAEERIPEESPHYETVT